MSTGPYHYSKAEELLEDVSLLLEAANATDLGREGAAQVLAGTTPVMAAAQVHATLALTAATAEAAFDPESRALAPHEWRKVLS